MASLIWGVIVVLFVLWVLGFAIHIGGGLIHLLLVIALILLVFNIVALRAILVRFTRIQFSSIRSAGDDARSVFLPQI